ncbi:immunity 42 family protein [Ralstonia pseudosolanacearum]|uniref:Hypothethical protein n=1 Tax=Ralstonia solanacearum TaxID=305 RepID=A0A0S4X3V9_RALSL|nr:MULTISPECIES: immunity 42 family protein [Ralstonia]UZF13333.1 immunity 42 family protein [Ralstonia solanacearum]UZF28398.1 immunity 42 family protein [Ralstonia sp. RS650]CUV58596.1 Hypothethical protein [Ralstonia solanacearum]
MSMLFGKKERFAVEFELDNDHGGAWLFGRFCYWIGGERVGDYDAGASLRDVLFQLKHIVGDGGKRFCPPLAALPATQSFKLIFDALRETNSEIFNYVSLDFMPACFDVCIPVEIFNAWNIFLVEGIEEAKLIYQADGVPDTKLTNLSVGEFDVAIKTAYAELEGLLAKEL